MTDYNIEKTLIQLIATDRAFIPISSLKGKLERARPKLGKIINIKDFPKQRFEGERAYAWLEVGEPKDARTQTEAINEFCEEYPKYGQILKDKIEEKRDERERHLYFNMNPGKKLTSEDYMDVLRDCKLSESVARSFYPELMKVSRELTKKRKEAERKVLIG